ncbi:hypothetical protein CBR_g4014 [Chara braunii]|uniref:Uncharacterized protein n=1 Tax=Chara braunii TaxID=69332 RepID=A0A388KH46_CHABU|nr:hypothetical protein CBR_g4014 [Chara braunii]|eukprot:GBG69317.1 hypothetical protein CBR_g4014 [Chara braunii]
MAAAVSESAASGIVSGAAERSRHQVPPRGSRANRASDVSRGSALTYTWRVDAFTSGCHVAVFPPKPHAVNPERHVAVFPPKPTVRIGQGKSNEESDGNQHHRQQSASSASRSAISAALPTCQRRQRLDGGAPTPLFLPTSNDHSPRGAIAAMTVRRGKVNRRGTRARAICENDGRDGATSSSSSSPVRRKVMLTCRQCKRPYDPDQNHPGACRYHTAHWGGETRRKFESVHSGGTSDTPDGGKISQYWHCCGSPDPSDLGCVASRHVSYDE